VNDLFGQGGEAKHFINNHLRFTILYHKDIETDLARIVGFEVQPTSVHHEYKEWDAVNPVLETCSEARHPLDAGASLPPQLLEEGGEVVFTYDVFFKVRLHLRLQLCNCVSLSAVIAEREVLTLAEDSVEPRHRALSGRRAGIRTF
jgi:hypothetical protein